MALNALRTYYAILDGSERARYLRSKEVGAPAVEEASLRDLWEAHDSAMRDHAQCSATSLLDLKAVIADRLLSSCILCERKCGVDRRVGKKGHCGVLEPRISSDFLHMGEEPDLIPSYTVFFSGCTFNCVFCQNWDISTRPGSGEVISPDEMARMIEARDPHASSTRSIRGRSPGSARNVNWVGGDPTSNLPFILEVLRICNANIPQVWNSNMYLSPESMRLLDGVIDLYLTDFKYGNDECAMRLSNAPNYMEVVKRNHKMALSNGEMIIRHLVLPGHIDCCTRPTLEWIAANLSPVKVNVMAQYRPHHRAREFQEISRGLRLDEFERAIQIADELGLDLCE